jgi:glucose/arabinose dehydrogenase
MRHTSLASMVLTFGILACGDSGSTGGSGGTGATGAGGDGAGPTSGGGGSGATGAGASGATGGGGSGAGATGGGGDGAGGIGAQGPGFTCDAAVGDAPELTFTEVVTGLSQPVLVRSPPGRPETLFIVEQGGRIKIFENGQVLATPFLNVADVIQAGGEEGLLGLAFHPEYATNGRFFIHYSNDGNGDSTIMEYKRSEADPNVADTTPVQLVLQIPTEQPNHNGGSIEFGNDGFLYIAFGDGGGSNDTDCDSQTLGDNLLGKIVRLDVNAAPDASGYPAAAGNPEGAKYFHIGLRNPWRMAFDACTGDLYIGDVGQGEREEIDVATPGAGALNFGWPLREGTFPFDNDPDPNEDTTCTNQPNNLVDPVTDYDSNNGNCSVTGGTLYRGTQIPGLRGAYFYGDYCSGQIFSLRAVNGALVGQPQFVFQLSSISSFGNDGNGNVYVVLLQVANEGGKVFRIDAAQ